MKVDRLISIIMVLLDKERISAQKLADMFEVSLRTIYRDIDAIDLAGIPIRSTSGVGGGFEIMPKYKIDKNVFSSADLTAILQGLSSLSTTIQGEEYLHALTKVKSFIPDDYAEDIAFHMEQIHIDGSSWLGKRNLQPYLKLIKQAMQEKRLLLLAYVDLRGNKTIRSIEPYQLVMKSSHWYVQGYCLCRNDVRLFRLSRISDLQIQDEHFVSRDVERPQLDIQDIVESMQTHIKLRIHKSIMERVLDYCDFDQFVPDGDAHYLVMFPFIENDYYFDILLGFGNRCECLEPAHIRQKFIHIIQDLASIYES